MTATKVKYLRKKSEEINNIAQNDGQIIFNKDTGEVFVDQDQNRIKINFNNILESTEILIKKGKEGFLREGLIIKTLCYKDPMDNGGAIFKIIKKGNNPENSIVIPINDNLDAQLFFINNIINPAQLGIFPSDNNAVDLFNFFKKIPSNCTVNFNPGGHYHIYFSDENKCYPNIPVFNKIKAAMFLEDKQNITINYNNSIFEVTNEDYKVQDCSILYLSKCTNIKVNGGQFIGNANKIKHDSIQKDEQGKWKIDEKTKEYLTENNQKTFTLSKSDSEEIVALVGESNMGITTWGDTSAENTHNSSYEIANMKIKLFSGDGIITSNAKKIPTAPGPGSPKYYIKPTDKEEDKSFTYIHDCEISHCARQGISIEDTENIKIQNVYIHDIGNFKYKDKQIPGIRPGLGIDIEPEWLQNFRVENVLLDNVTIKRTSNLALKNWYNTNLGANPEYKSFKDDPYGDVRNFSAHNCYFENGLYIAPYENLILDNNYIGLRSNEFFATDAFKGSNKTYLSCYNSQQSSLTNLKFNEDSTDSRNLDFGTENEDKLHTTIHITTNFIPNDPINFPTVIIKNSILNYNNNLKSTNGYTLPLKIYPCCPGYVYGGKESKEGILKSEWLQYASTETTWSYIIENDKDNPRQTFKVGEIIGIPGYYCIEKNQDIQNRTPGVLYGRIVKTLLNQSPQKSYKITIQGIYFDDDIAISADDLWIDTQKNPTLLQKYLLILNIYQHKASINAILDNCYIRNAFIQVGMLENANTASTYLSTYGCELNNCTIENSYIFLADEALNKNYNIINKNNFYHKGNRIKLLKYQLLSQKKKLIKEDVYPIIYQQYFNYCNFSSSTFIDKTVPESIIIKNYCTSI